MKKTVEKTTYKLKEVIKKIKFKTRGRSVYTLLWQR